MHDIHDEDRHGQAEDICCRKENVQPPRLNPNEGVEGAGKNENGACNGQGWRDLGLDG